MRVRNGQSGGNEWPSGRSGAKQRQSLSHHVRLCCRRVVDACGGTAIVLRGAGPWSVKSSHAPSVSTGHPPLSSMYVCSCRSIRTCCTCSPCFPFSIMRLIDRQTANRRHSLPPLCGPVLLGTGILREFADHAWSNLPMCMGLSIVVSGRYHI